MNQRWSAQAFPGYTDCHLRLACIAAARGDSDAALEWARRALERRPKLADAQAMLGERNPSLAITSATESALAASKDRHGARRASAAAQKACMCHVRATGACLAVS